MQDNVLSHIKLFYRIIYIIILLKIVNTEASHLKIHFVADTNNNVPSNTDFNFERLFFSNHSATNFGGFTLEICSLLHAVQCHRVNGKKKNENLFPIPPPPGQNLFPIPPPPPPPPPPTPEPEVLDLSREFLGGGEGNKYSPTSIKRPQSIERPLSKVPI